MRRSACLLLVWIAAAVACQREKPAPPPTATRAPQTQTVPPPPEEKPLLNRSRLGSVIGRDGTVTEEKTTFTREDLIFLTMWFREPSADLQARVQWFDETGIVVTEERRPTFGLPDVTFALAVRQPKAGNYRVVGYAGDKVAVEYRFVVTQ